MMNYRKSIFFILVILILSITGCKSENLDSSLNAVYKEKVTIAVSIVPEETFVKAVSGDLVDVITMIPPGHSPANYEPTPSQMIKFSKAKVYFSIGVPTEEANILPKINSLNNDLKVVSLAEKVKEVYPERNFAGGRDPHIWLSPKRVKVMIEVIKDELIELDPNNKSIYEKNSNKYIAELNEINSEIKEILNDVNQQSFIIYHPAFGYFADEYGLTMVSIEEVGKEATSKRLQEVIDFAKKENIKFIFYQDEFDSQQAETIAEEINGTTVNVSPLASEYIENLKLIANKFREKLNN